MLLSSKLITCCSLILFACVHQLVASQKTDQNNGSLFAPIQPVSNNNNNNNNSNGNGVDQNKQSPDSAVAVFKEPNGWLMKILREFFSDIHWKKIAEARDEVEKFIRRVDKIMNVFSSGKKTDAQMEQDLNGGRLWSSSWWNSSGAPTTASPHSTSKADASKFDDSTNVKEMLQRVACFVGYMRILNNSQQALAELDAAKIVSNLFTGGKPSSFWSSWFG